MKTLNDLNEQVSPTSLLEDLRSNEPKAKLNAIKNLNVIAYALGKERTRNELIPFLADSIDEEEDETLIELAKILSNFLEYIGGKQYIMKIIKLLEYLLVIDEVSVRNEALISFKILLSQINPGELENELMELITRLAESDYSPQKQSAINLIPLIFRYVSKENKRNLHEYLKKFSIQETPSIKKELAVSLKDLSNVIDDDLFVDLFTTLLTDQNDTVRIHLFDAIVSLKSHNKLENFSDFISNVLQKLSSDESWRVRLTVADKLHQMLNFPYLLPQTKSLLINIFAKMFEDNEAEIRNICCLRLEAIAEKIGKEEIFDKVLVELKKIEKDSVSYVRGALAATMLRICPLIGKNKTSDYIFPIFLNLIKDESHDIRMTIIKSLDRLNEVLNIDVLLPSLIPSLVEIASNKSWRVRIQITESIPVMARIMNKSLFMENIFPLSISWLTDPVFAIREAGCKLVKKLYDIFRSDELEKRVLEKLNEMKTNNSYLIRNTILQLAKEFLNDEFDHDFLEKKLLSFIIKLSKDKISNIRMNACFLLKRLSLIFKSRDTLHEIKACLDELRRDPDQDVLNILNDN